MDINLSSLLVTEYSNTQGQSVNNAQPSRRMKAYNKIIQIYKVHYYLIIKLSTSQSCGPNFPFNVNHSSNLCSLKYCCCGMSCQKRTTNPKQIYFYLCPRLKYLIFLPFWLFYMTSARAGFKSSRRDSRRISPRHVSPLSFDSSRRVTFAFQ